MTKVLTWFGISDDGKCNCKSHAKQMDRWGPQKCRENLETILDWLQATATKRGLPFIRMGAKMAVLAAIKLSERDIRRGKRPDKH